MKYIILVLLVTNKIDYFTLNNVEFHTFRECVEFQRYANSQQQASSNYVFLCHGVKKK